MALSLASPGIKVREVDLTRGGITNTTSLSAGIAGPFAKGPVNEVVTIATENDLVTVFGKPSKADYHYEYWYSASNFLSYGGSLKVVRCSGTQLKNSNAGVGADSVSLLIENLDDYQLNHSADNTFYWAAKNPGYWAEDLSVRVIDDFADQTLQTINTTSVSVGFGVTQTFSKTVPTTSGTTTTVTGFLKGVVTGIGVSEIYVKVLSTVTDGVETPREYTDNGVYSFAASALNIVNNSGSVVATRTPGSVSDWYNSQYILSTAEGDTVDLLWKSVAPKPRTNQYVLERGGSNDSFHVAVIDSTKSTNVSGSAQTILETFTNLSKASDTTISGSQNIYYKDYLAQNSNYIFAGKSLGDSSDANWSLAPVSVKFSSNFTLQSIADGSWGTSSENKTFNSIGHMSFPLSGGKDYSGVNNVGGFSASLTDLITAYDKFSNTEEISLNYLLQGSASLSKTEEQAKANKLIDIADNRKDCVAFISPYRTGVVNITNQATQLNNILDFFSPLTSSSYGVFDSGYQYIYDRFNQQFVYIPCSADVAGLCVRTDIEQYPWFSPAGKARGSLKFPIKLAYNPGQSHRDSLYSQRINPIISSPGSGFVLFGDKTALSYQSAFDRINVRRLFITIEQAIKSSADAQLFEFNDSTTRANFINLVEPYLRDVKAKRGITDFLLVCDETNNTPDVIDRNEFVADIYVKPARSINFITLTFVATRTGISFQSIVGTV